MIVHDGRAINQARKAFIAATFEAGTPDQGPDAVIFERDLVPYEKARYGALSALLAADVTEVSVTSLSNKPEVNFTPRGGEKPTRTAAPEEAVKRALDGFVCFFATRGHEPDRGSWTVRRGAGPEHDLFYA